MGVLIGLDDVPAGWHSAATLGAFDGVHRGHQSLVRRTVEAARERGLCSVVLTFDPDPDQVLRADRAAPLLTTTPERVELLAALGADHVVVARFDGRVAATEAMEFVREVLIGSLGARCLVVGPTLTFGSGGAGATERLREWAPDLGLEVEVVPAVLLEGRAVTSSAIREEVRAGNVAAAREMLGRPYSLTGVVERGHGRGRRLGCPTANIAPDSRRLIPGDGVYAVEAGIDQVSCLGVASVGTRPTFPGAGWALEVHLPGLEADLRSRRMRVRFWARLRGHVRFATPEELSAQMASDVRDAQAVMAALHRPPHLVE
jgi:riboflavin kinase/FMN adenylyltransferase